MSNNKNLIAYQGDAVLKQQFVALVLAHQEADQIIQSEYWTGNRGCAVGCSIDSLRTLTGLPLDMYRHALYEKYLGVPEILAWLEDSIFEGLPIEDARQWPSRFAGAIPVGADLFLVWPRFAVWLLTDPQDGEIKYAQSDASRKAINDVAQLYERLIAVSPVSLEAFARAARAAYDTDATAAYYAAYAAARDPEDADAAADAAAAYYADRDDATEDVGTGTARRKQADKLLELLAGAPLVEVGQR